MLTVERKRGSGSSRGNQQLRVRRGTASLASLARMNGVFSGRLEQDDFVKSNATKTRTRLLRTNKAGDQKV